MRILVTKQGNIIIQEIDETMPSYTQNLISTNKTRGFSTSYFQRNSKIGESGANLFQFYRTNKPFARNSNNISSIVSDSKIFSRQKSYYKRKYKNLEDSEITKEELQMAKQVKLNDNKINFPKQFAEKYENDIISNNIINSSGNILSSFNSKKIEGPDGSNSSLIRKEKYLSLGEIIPNNSKIEMKKKIIKDRLIRDRDTVITENDFRTAYDPETDIQKFNNILNESKLNSNKSSLIRYLKDKKVNPLTVKILSYQDSDKISKINKMCQTIFQNQDKEKLFNDIVKNKTTQKINNTKKELQIGINNIGNEINCIQEKLKKYEKRVDNKEKYREHFNDMVIHHWLKRDFERFNKKSTPKPYYLRTFFDEEDNENSKK